METSRILSKWLTRTLSLAQKSAAQFLARPVWVVVLFVIFNGIRWRRVNQHRVHNAIRACGTFSARTLNQYIQVLRISFVPSAVSCYENKFLIHFQSVFIERPTSSVLYWIRVKSVKNHRRTSLWEKATLHCYINIDTHTQVNRKKVKTKKVMKRKRREIKWKIK